MSDSPPGRPKPPTPPNRHRSPEELKRLEAALRANLKRRRAQKNARDEPPAVEDQDPAKSGTD